MVMKAHKKIKSGMWLIVETVLVFVLGWFLADPEIMKLYRSMFIPMGWDYENVVVVPVEVLPDYDPDYRPEAMERERMTEDFRRMGEVLSSVSGVEYAAPCRPYFPGIDNHMYGRVFRDSTHFMACSMLYRVTGSDFMEVFGYEWVQPESSPFLTEDAVGRVVVSEDLAEFLFPGENPIGRSFESTESGNNVVVGVIPRQKLREITGVPTPVLIANIAAVNYDELSNGGAYWVARVADGTDLDSFLPELNRVLSSQASFGNLRAAAAWPLENKLQASMDVSLHNVGLIYLVLNLVLGAFSFWLLSSRKNQDEYGVRQAMGATPARLRLSAVARACRSTAIAVGIGIVLVLNVNLVLGRESATVGAEFFGVYPAAETLTPWPVLTSGPLSVLMVTAVVAAAVFLMNIFWLRSSPYGRFRGCGRRRPFGRNDHEVPPFHIAPLFRPNPQRQWNRHFPAVAEAPELADPCERCFPWHPGPPLLATTAATSAFSCRCGSTGTGCSLREILPGPPRSSAPCHNGSGSCISLPLRKYGAFHIVTIHFRCVTIC